MIDSAKLPPNTPPEIAANYLPVKEWDKALLLSCDICGTDIETWVDKDGVILPKHVTALARHLFVMHYMNGLHGTARGEVHGDHCHCQFCQHRRTCTTPGDVECKEGPSNGI